MYIQTISAKTNSMHCKQCPIARYTFITGFIINPMLATSATIYDLNSVQLLMLAIYFPASSIHREILKTRAWRDTRLLTWLRNAPSLLVFVFRPPSPTTYTAIKLTQDRQRLHADESWDRQLLTIPWRIKWWPGRLFLGPGFFPFAWFLRNKI